MSIRVYTREDYRKKMKRSEIREQIFILLFRVEFNSLKEMSEQLELFLADDLNEASAEDKAAIKEKYERIMNKLGEIDEMINQLASGWRTTRMGRVDLTILRLAVFEIKFDENVPTGVAINEAVELAKKYGQDGSSSFVNGVLAKFA